MCHGHPRQHPCSHVSINWHYCPAALIDLDTGIETPCSHLSYAASQRSNLDCPLQSCKYKAMGGSWTCCQCSQGSNTLGWCTNTVWRELGESVSGIIREPYQEESCAHGCCERCTRTSTPRSPAPQMTFSELRKGTASRQFGYNTGNHGPHRRGSAFSLLRGFPPVSEEDQDPSNGSGSELSCSPAASKSSMSSAGDAGRSSTVTYAIDPDYQHAKEPPLSPSSARKHKTASTLDRARGAKKQRSLVD